MLTKQEKKWLEERKKRTQHCDTCPNRVGYYELCSSCRSRSLYGLSLCPDYRDAAEFEARVAVVAATGAQPCLVDDELPLLGGECPEGKGKECFRFSLCFTHCGLKHARLYVEEEMDNERNHS